MSVLRIEKPRKVFLAISCFFKGCILFCVVYGGRKGGIQSFLRLSNGFVCSFCIFCYVSYFWIIYACMHVLIF